MTACYILFCCCLTSIDKNDAHTVKVAAGYIGPNTLHSVTIPDCIIYIYTFKKVTWLIFFLCKVCVTVSDSRASFTSFKGMFLYSAVSSPLDRSKRFTLFLP